MKRFLLVVFIVLLNISLVKSQSVQDGVRHIELEQYESSRKVFRDLLKKNPSDPEIYYYLGEVCLKLEKSDSALSFFKEGINKKEDFALNYVGLGKVLNEKNPSEARINFEKALALSKSKDEKVLSSLADHYINSNPKNIDQAILLLEKAIKLDAKNPSHYVLMGDAYLEKGDGSKAMSYYNQGFDLNKKWPYPYLKIGKLYAKARNFNLAVEYYNKGLSIDPSYGPLYREIGEVYYKARQYNKAIESYKKYVELSDKSFDTDLRYASFLYFNQDYVNAVSLLSKLAIKDSKHLVVNRLLAYSYFETGDFSKGLSVMENLWKSESQKFISSDYEYYGKFLSKTGKDSLAIVNYRKAIEMDTSKYELYSEIGNIYFLSKKYGDAANAYKLKVSAMKKATAQEYLLLGKAYYYDRQYQLADSAFSSLISLSTNSPTGYLWRARANAYLDEDLSKGLARPYYEKYIELVQTDSAKYKKELIEAYSSIGAYYMKRKDKSNADIAWKKVKDLDPSNTNVDQYINAKY